MDLKKRKINGVTVEIRVDDDGQFQARVAGEWLTADTLKGLEAQLAKTLKRAKIKVAIPATMLGVQKSTHFAARGSRVSGNGTRDILLVGIHSGNGNLLIRDDVEGSAVEQVTGFRQGNDIVRRLTKEEAATYTRLQKEKQAAESAAYDFEKRVKVDAEKLIRAAIAEKTDDPTEPEVDDDEDPRTT